MAQIPNYLQKFINKAVTSVTFPDDDKLNVTAFDMGEDMASMSIDEESVKRLKVAFGDVGAVEVAVPVTINLSISKVTVAADIWRDRILTNGLISGLSRTCVFTDDTGRKYTVIACTISMGEISANASNPAYSFTIKGNLAVNTDLYGVLIG